MRQLAMAFSVTVLLASPAAAQQPDFSGAWVAADAVPGGKPAPMALGPQFTIVQQGTSLMLTRQFAGISGTIRYTLDGSETTSRMPGRLCEPDSGATWTASWDGPAIVIAMIGVTPPNGTSVKADVRTTLRLDGANTLRAEAVARVAGQAEPRTTTTVYKRTGPAPAIASPAARAAKATMAQVAWMAGTWTGTRGSSPSGPPERGALQIEERWTPPGGGAMLAISRTLRDGLMPAFEFLCIVERDGGLVYQAMPNGRMPATDFTLTTIDESSATFENPAHDFPKMIRYTKKADGSLEAVISGANGAKPQTFVFVRQ